MDSDRLSPRERSLRATLAAHTRWAQEDPKAAMANVRAGLTAKFERQVDAEFPGLAPDERARRVESLRRAHMAKMSLASAAARRARARGAA